MLKKSLLVLLFSLIFSFSAFAGGKEKTINSPNLFTPGKLTVATGEPVYPPWMMDDNPAGGAGFENGLVYALAAKLGFKKEDVVWVRQTFDQGIAPGKKSYDFNIQQYSVTEERKKFVGFSNVYYKPEKAVVALPSTQIANAASFDDLKKLKWGATIGTADLNYIENKIGVKDVAVFNEQVATFQALLSKQIDATVISLPTALFVTAVQVPEAKVAAILPHDSNDLGHGLVFEKGNPLIEWINEGLDAIIKEGVIEDLTAKYLIGSDAIPEISK
jgi:polar amino acid transport system substrate-binding protein